MHYRTRRKVDVALLAGGGLALGVAAAAAAGLGDTERIDGYWALARIPSASSIAEANVNGSVNGTAGGVPNRAEVTEVIDYDFGAARRHGIFRDVDDLDPTAPIEVTSPTAPDEVLVHSISSFTSRIRVGDPDRTISGRHRYRIDYPLDTLVTVTPGSNEVGDQLVAWDAVGHRWPVAMSDIEIHLIGDTEFTDLECSTGPVGAWGGCTLTQPEPGHLTVRIEKLAPHEGVTISAARGAALNRPPAAPPAPSGPADDPGTGFLLPGAAALAGAMAAGAIGSRQVRRGGRELAWAGGAADAAYGPQIGQDFPVRLVDHAELNELANIEFTPPKGLTAWQGGVLHRESVGQDQQVAWLLERAAAGEVGFSGVDTSGRRPKGTLSLHHLADSPDPGDREALRALFGGRNQVDLGTYDKQFAAGWKRLGHNLESWLDQSPLWDPTGDRRRTEARIIGAVAGVIGLVVLAGAAVAANRVGVPWLVGVGLGAALAGTGWALLLRSWELRVRTPEGSGLWILTESFRRFIEQSDAQHVEAAAREGHLREYTAWATALGEADHWRDMVREADLDPSVETAGIQHALLANHLGSAVSTASTAPSSSGSGGGGGSVGGGGGGGGGGSW